MENVAELERAMIILTEKVHALSKERDQLSRRVIAAEGEIEALKKEVAKRAQETEMVRTKAKALVVELLRRLAQHRPEALKNAMPAVSDSNPAPPSLP